MGGFVNWPHLSKDPPHRHHDPAGHVHFAIHAKNVRYMSWALLLTGLFASFEGITGWMVHSLTLLSDAGHMGSDAISLVISLVATRMAEKPPTQRHSYGLQRAEVLAALINGLLLLVVVGIILFEAVGRLQHPVFVSGWPVIWVATLGLALNGVNGLMLLKMEQGLNTRAALLHVKGDFLGSLAALISGLIIWRTGWMVVDPILSLVVVLIMAYSTLHIIRDSVHILMEGVPEQVSLQEVGDHLLAIEGVLSVHDLHIWTLASGLLALSAHLEVRNMGEWPNVLLLVQQMLNQGHGINHVTLQPEVSRGGEQPITFHAKV